MNYDKILERISPTQEDISRLNASIASIKSFIETAARKKSIKLEVVPGGSTAKGTFLKGNFDVDIFVRFKQASLDLSSTLELLLTSFAVKKNIVIERVHGSRDYFNFVYDNLFFEIVPVQYITTPADAKNVTDMSPLHVFWVSKLLTPKLQKDIRLAKQFCKACGVYGAESFINGLSGHVLDILVITYGGFEELLTAASSWSSITVVDPEKKHDDVFKELNQAKLVSPLIVIDPIDSQRNAAAALSQEKYDLFIKTAKAFIQEPSEDFFIIPKFDIDALIAQKTAEQDLFVVQAIPLLGKKDVVATKVLKVFEFLNRHLKLHEFTIERSSWHYAPELCQLFFFVKKETLSKTMLHQGPPLNNLVDVKRFKEIHPNFFEKDDRLYSKVDRQFTNSKDCIYYLLNQKFVTQRIASFVLQDFNA